MPKRIPIKALKDFCKAQGLQKAILFANDGKHDHIVTYGRDIVDCAQAAQFGNMLKSVLNWPAELHTEPKRLITLQRKVNELTEENKKLKEGLRDTKKSG